MAIQTHRNSAPLSSNFLGWKILPISDPRVRRVTQLVIGIAILGVGVTLSVIPMLGTGPWGVFAQGLANYTPLTFGTATMGTGLVLVMLFRFIGQPLGLGTVLNATFVGILADIFMAIIPEPTTMLPRLAMIIAAPVLIGWGSGLYIGAGLGPGPRDGLMTSMVRMGLSTRTARTILEFSALTFGWLLGGDANWGTLWIAASIPQFVAYFIPKYVIDAPKHP